MAMSLVLDTAWHALVEVCTLLSTILLPCECDGFFNFLNFSIFWCAYCTGCPTGTILCRIYMSPHLFLHYIKSIISDWVNPCEVNQISNILRVTCLGCYEKKNCKTFIIHTLLCCKSYQRLVCLCSRMVTVLAWTGEGPGFKSWFGHLSVVGML